MSDGFSTSQATIGFSATLPATHDQAGFEALTFTESCEVTNMGEYGESVAVNTYETVCDNTVNKFLGAVDYGDQTLEFAYAPGHPAEVLLDSARDSKAEVAVKIVHGDGSTAVYNKAIVSSGRISMGGNSDLTKKTITLNYSSGFVVVI